MTQIWPATTSHPSDGYWVLTLPWGTPPLSLNDRIHWSTKSTWTKTLRQTAWALAKQAKIPPLPKGCQVGLVYEPPDRRRRDEDNLFATLKPLADGLVDAGVVADDTPDLMRKECRITDPVQPSKLTLHVIANTGRWLW